MVKFSLHSFLKFFIKSVARMIYHSIFNFCASFTFYWIGRNMLQLQKYSVDSEKQNPRNLDSKKVIPNIFHKHNLAFVLFLLVIAIWWCPTSCCFIGITSEHIVYRQITEIISFKYRVSISKEHVMNLVESWFGFLFQPQIMILLLLQISILKLLQIWSEHQIHREWTWVQKTFIMKNFKYFSLKTVTAFCTLHQPGTSK